MIPPVVDRLYIFQAIFGQLVVVIAASIAGFWVALALAILSIGAMLLLKHAIKEGIIDWFELASIERQDHQPDSDHSPASDSSETD